MYECATTLLPYDLPQSYRRFLKGQVRLYRHFAFRVAPEPPFQIMAVSDELPLVFNATYRVRDLLKGSAAYAMFKLCHLPF